MRLPGLGPKTAASHLAGARCHDDRGAEGGGRAGAAAHAGGPRREDRGEDPQGARREEAGALRRGGCSATGWRPLLAVVDALRQHPAAVKVSEAGSARRRKETFRDLDIIATATDPEALIDYFTKLKWVIEVVAKAADEGDGPVERGLRFDLRVVPPESYGNLLQHFTGSKDHNVALRERAVQDGCPSPSTRVTVVETGGGAQVRRRGAGVRAARLSVHPARAARERRRARSRAARRAAEARRARRHQAATSTRTRPGSDGQRLARARWSRAAQARGYEYYADHRPLRTGTFRRAGSRRSTQLNERLEAVPDPERRSR